MIVLIKKPLPPSKRAYYRIRSQEGKNKYLISKLDGNLEVKASYAMYDDFENKLTCNCPSRKRPCKHVAFLAAFLREDQIDGELLFDPEHNRFISIGDI